MIDLQMGTPSGSPAQTFSASHRTGCRPATKRQIEATARLTGHFKAVPRWRARATFEITGIHLEFSDKATELVRVLTGFSFNVD